MKRLILFALVTLLAALDNPGAAAKENLDTLLPPPFWLRSRAEELNIDAQTRNRIEQIYQEKEPKYHEIKQQVQQLTEQLYAALVADQLDEALILQRMQALLEVENELKLYQVHVRISLLAQLSTEQRRSARELAKWKPEADWQGNMFKKVERVRELTARLQENGESLTEIEKRMQEIDSVIAAGKITKASRMLDQTIGNLEKSLK